ncbi:MAG: acetate--CoA ligase family protein [Burkholderiaceae bacterium]
MNTLVKKLSNQLNYGDLSSLFHPRTVAVVGASEDPRKFGGRVLAYLSNGDWSGDVIPIHPELVHVQGISAFSSIGAVDRDIDLAVIAVPQKSVESTLDQCIDAGVKTAMIYASGYAENSAFGKTAQTTLIKKARLAGLRILGPNCIGVANAQDRFAATFATMWQDGWQSPGCTAIVSQSGAMASYFYVMLKDRGIGISKWCSTGNEGDIDIAEFISYVAEDNQTRIVIAAMEGISNGTRLLDAVRKISVSKKPVIFIKLGRSKVGQLAAASHTGSLAGEERVFDALIQQAGGIVVSTFSEAVDIASAFVGSPLPAGKRLGIVTASGGGGIMAADKAEMLGLDVPELESLVRDKIDPLIPGGNSRNPVDVTAMVLTNMDLMVPPIVHVAHSENTDALIVFLTSAFRSEDKIKKLIEQLHAHQLQATCKPIIFSLFTSPSGFQLLQAAGFPAYLEPVRAVEVIAALSNWQDRLGKINFEKTLEQNSFVLPALKDEASFLSMFASFGLNVAKTVLVHSEQEAIKATQRLGPVVVMKLSVPDLAHKSDIGGVILNIANSEDAKNAWNQLSQIYLKLSIDEKPKLIVQQQMTGGVELMLGMKIDSDFDKVMLVGMGGKWVEILDDVSICKPPIEKDQAFQMLKSLKGFPLLNGARGSPTTDIDAAIEAMVAFSQFASQAQGIESAEINPLVVGLAGQGSWAVDAKIKFNL